MNLATNLTATTRHEASRTALALGDAELSQRQRDSVASALKLLLLRFEPSA